MRQKQSGIALSQRGSVVLTLRDPVFVEMHFAGYVDVVEPLTHEVSRSVPPRTALLLDCTDMTGLAVAARGAAVGLFRQLKAAGVLRITCVAPFSGQRSIVAALAFVAEIPCSFSADHDGALLR